ncbi:MAG: PEP-CTERM system TPR-repeat protein PrsT, partial [Pseudomonadales bacterium]|nr:PEP-CTERM system TPR-repeat protein PrsT [Pseudomonadales bacterium]
MPTSQSPKKKSPWPARFKMAAIAAAVSVPLTAAAYFFVWYEPALSDQEYFDSAQQNYQKGDSRTAVIELKNALKANSNHTEARFLLGKIYVELGQGASAQKELERSSGFKTDPAELKRMLAKAFLLQGKPQKALDALSSGADASRGYSFDENILTAQAYFDLREWANSVDSYNRALAQRPGSIQATVSLARIAFIEGDIAIAQTHLAKLGERAEKSWQAWSLKGDIARTEAQLPKAKLAYQQAFELNSNAIEPRLYHAMIALQEENFDEAAIDAKALVAIHSKHPAGHYILGELHFANKDYQLAQPSFEEAIRYVDYLPAFRQLGITHFQLGNLVQAEEYLKKYLAQSPQDLQAQQVLSATYIKQNKLGEAKSLLKSAATKADLNEPLLRMMAGLEQATGESEKATGILSRLLEANPNSTGTRLQLGQTLLRQGKPQEALFMFQQVAQQEPSSTQAKLFIVSTQIQLGNYRSALSTSSELTTLEPDNPQYASIDGVIFLMQGEQQKALAIFNKSQEKYPGDYISGNQLGLISIRAKKYEEAKGYYERVLAHNENHLQSQIQIGLLENALEHPKLAQKALEAAISSHPDNHKPKLILARYYMVKNEPQKAINWLQQIDETNKQSPQFLFTLGQAYLVNGQAAQATDTLTKLNGISPNFLSYSLEAKAKFIQKDLTGSRAALLKAKKLAPENKDIDAALFEILLVETETSIREKNYITAEKGLAKVKENDNQIPYLVLTANLNESKGDFGSAISGYKEALALKPHSKIIASLIRALTRSGDTTQAEAQAKQWLETHPDDNEIAFLLTNTLLGTDRTEETIQQYETLLIKQPKNVIVLNNLAFLYIDSDLKKAAEYA